MNDVDAEKAGGHCWSEIGVWTPDASPSCPKLKTVTHCANCDVFIAKGRGLFDLAPSPSYIADWTKQLSDSRGDSVTGRESLLVFRLCDEWLAFPSAAFKAVADLAPIHSIPHKSDSVLLGIVNIGGALQLCFSLKAFLGIDSSHSPAPQNLNPMVKPRLLILERSSQLWVFPADEILGVFDYDSS